MSVRPGATSRRMSATNSPMTLWILRRIREGTMRVNRQWRAWPSRATLGWMTKNTGEGGGVWLTVAVGLEVGEGVGVPVGEWVNVAVIEGVEVADDVAVEVGLAVNVKEFVAVGV